jgi:hypothetical protein
MTAGRPRQHSVETLVLAYELHTEGVSWRRIERILGAGVHNAVRWAKRRGIRHAR